MIFGEQLMNFAKDKRRNNKDKIHNMLDKKLKKEEFVKSLKKLYFNVTKKSFVNDNVQENFIEEKYYTKLRNFELLMSVISILSIAVTIVHYEISYDGGKEKDNKDSVILLYILSAFTIIMITNIYLYEKITLQKLISLKKLHPSETLISTGKWVNVLIYILMVIIHPNPISTNQLIVMSEGDTKMYYSINSLFAIFVFTRFVFVFRCYLFFSPWMTPRMKKICQKFNFEVNFMFCLKGEAKRSPMLFYIVSMLISIFTFSYSVRIFERPLTAYRGDDLANYFNAVWYIFITMATVGYGDYTAAATGGGRIIAMISCITGVFLISTMIMTITNLLNFDLPSFNMFLILKKIEINESNKQSAENLIYEFLSLSKNESVKKTIKEESKEFRGLNSAMNKFKIENHRSDFFTSTYDFHVLNNGLNSLDKNQIQIKNKKLELKDSMDKIERKLDSISKSL